MIFASWLAKNMYETATISKGRYIPSHVSCVSNLLHRAHYPSQKNAEVSESEKHLLPLSVNNSQTRNLLQR